MTERQIRPDWQRIVPLAILAVSAGALAVAYTAQYAFGVEPCRLCLYQRVPYAVNSLLAILALGLPAGRARAWTVALCAAFFLAGAAIAFHHVGVERHWWVSAASCGGGGEVAEMTLEEMKARLVVPAEKPCDVVDWTLFGLSMATYNVAVSLAMAAAAIAGAIKLART